MHSPIDRVDNIIEGQGSDSQIIHNASVYQQWRKEKLANYPSSIEKLMVTISSIEHLTKTEKQQILNNCHRYNMCLYQLKEKEIDSLRLKIFAENFGLVRLNHHLHAENDGISVLTNATDGPKEAFIPYTDKKLGWHTDGYYNQPAERIKTFLLHCQTSAFEGGENALCDPDIVYILLEDKNPDYIKALMADDCMTIPAYDDATGTKRLASSGAVFIIDKVTGKLHMRYTERKHNISWKNDKLTKEAVAYLTEILSSDGFPVIRHRLEAGQGMITNNVLHNRSAFIDDNENKRLFYRARYLDSIQH